MSTENIPEASLDDVLDAAIAGQDSSQEATTNAQEGAAVVPQVPEGAVQPQPFELPGYTKRWSEERRAALQKLAESNDHRPYVEKLLGQFEDAHKFIGQRDNELGEIRKRFDPVWEHLAPLERQYALQGMTLQQGVGQMVQAAQFIAQSPDQAFPWLAQAYKPRDPTKALQALASAWGADLQAVVQDAPYIDPSVQSLLNPLQQQVQQLTQRLQQQDTHARTTQNDALVQIIRSFESATDDNGNPKHPYLAEVFNDMVALGNTPGALKSTTPQEAIAEAYAKACRMNDTIHERIAAEQAKAAEEQARKAAAARSAEANKTAEAARTVTGKGKATKAKAMTEDDAIDAAFAEHGVA